LLTDDIYGFASNQICLFDATPGNIADSYFPCGVICNVKRSDSPHSKILRIMSAGYIFRGVIEDVYAPVSTTGVSSGYEES
jgi:hypothetical protein